MSSLQRILPTIAAAWLAAFAAPHAAAQSKTLGTGKASGPVLTRNELRQCLAQQGRVKAKRQEAEQLKEQLAKDKEEIQRRGDALKDKLVWLDRTSQEQVDQYNADAAERDKLIDAFQARSNGFSAQVDALNADREAWGRNCENRSYREEDEILIKAGK